MMRRLPYVFFGRIRPLSIVLQVLTPTLPDATIPGVKSWDAIIVGAGIIGLSLAIELRKSGMSVLVVEKGELAREASWAAGGMLADFFLETPPALHPLAAASAQMYPRFVQQLEAESALAIDLRSEGTLLFLPPAHDPSLQQSYPLPAPLAELEPAFKVPQPPALYLHERSIDPRHLTAAAIAAARNHGIHFATDDPVQAIEISDGKAAGVRTTATHYSAATVVNCAGAWASQIGCDASGGTGVPPVQTGQISIPTRPVKGQMLCVAMPEKGLVRHVVRTPDVYLIPRSNGHMVIGATQEEAGFDKQTVPETLQKLRHAAINLVPRLVEAKVLEVWAGLRPGTPDKLPILGETSTPGYFVATGHFRDGILLAPITARVMGQLITSQRPEFDLAPFSPQRFQ